MVITATGVEAPIPDDPFDPQGDLRDLAVSLAGRVIVPVVNESDRATVGGRLIADGTPPSPQRPFFVFREDAPAGRQLEYTINGTTWFTVSASGEETNNLSLVNGWQTANSDTPTLSRRGGFAWMAGTTYQSGSWNPQVATLPNGYRPPRKITRPLNAMNASNSDGPRGFVEIFPSGSVIVTPVSGSPSLSNTTWVYLPSEPYPIT